MVFPTQELQSKLEKERWTAQPETEAAMDYVFRRITQPESDSMSMLERVYRTCPEFQTQRDDQVQTAAFAILKDILKDAHCFFQADCPPDGRARFRLKIGDSQHALSKCVPAYREWSLNLLRDQADWVIPPKRTQPKSDSQSRAKPRLPAKGRS